MRKFILQSFNHEIHLQKINLCVSKSLEISKYARIAHTMQIFLVLKTYFIQVYFTTYQTWTTLISSPVSDANCSLTCLAGFGDA